MMKSRLVETATTNILVAVPELERNSCAIEMAELVLLDRVVVVVVGIANVDSPIC